MHQDECCKGPSSPILATVRVKDASDGVFRDQLENAMHRPYCAEADQEVYTLSNANAVLGSVCFALISRYQPFHPLSIGAFAPMFGSNKADSYTEHSADISKSAHMLSELNLPLSDSMLISAERLRLGLHYHMPHLPLSPAPVVDHNVCVKKYILLAL